MNRYELDQALSGAKGEGYIAGQETRKIICVVENERRDRHLETGILPDTADLAIKIRGTNPGWTTQKSLTEDPEEDLRFKRPARIDFSKTS